MPDVEHQKRVVSSVRCVVLTISDTRTPETDKSGALIRDLLDAAGHVVLEHEILPDDPQVVRRRVEHFARSGDCQVMLLTGGTGLAPRDTTYEAITAFLDKHLDGFGELFRMLSFEQVGAAAMLSRAVAGVRGRSVVFSMPGSTGAVRLAMEKLILPQLGHLVALVAEA